MPLYEYQCQDCQACFEKLVRAWGEAVACPECRSAAVSKQLSSFALSEKRGGVPASGGGCCAGGGCGCRR